MTGRRCEEGKEVKGIEKRERSQPDASRFHPFPFPSSLLFPAPKGDREDQTHLLQIPSRAPIRVRRLHNSNFNPSLPLPNAISLPIPSIPLTPIPIQPRLLHQIHKEPRRQRSLLIPIQKSKLSRLLLEVVEDDPIRVSVERAGQSTGDESGGRGREEDGREFLIGFDVVGSGVGVE